MEVILIKDVDNLGGINEVVKVKNGYARNFLLPRQLAVENSPSNRKQLEAVFLERGKFGFAVGGIGLGDFKVITPASKLEAVVTDLGGQLALRGEVELPHHLDAEVDGRVTHR